MGEVRVFSADEDLTKLDDAECVVLFHQDSGSALAGTFSLPLSWRHIPWMASGREDMRGALETR
jgi:hypothetical protein